MKSASGRKRRSPRSPARVPQPDRLTPRSLVPVLIAYSDIPAARQAMAQLTRLLRLSGAGLQPMLWRFDQLHDVRWREMALRDARRASAVAIAVANEVALDDAPESWLLSLLERGRGASLSLLAFIGMDETWTLTLEQAKPSATGATRTEPRPTWAATTRNTPAVRSVAR